MARNRAYRRAQKERARAKAAFVIDRVWRLFHPRLNREPRDSEKFARWRIEKIQQMTANRKPCSCWMCGNPRRWYGDLTIQELRLDGVRGLVYEES